MPVGEFTTYTDALELIADPAVDAVVVASPAATHEPYVLACSRPASRCCARSRWRPPPRPRALGTPIAADFRERFAAAYLNSCGLGAAARAWDGYAAAAVAEAAVSLRRRAIDVRPRSRA